MPPLTVVTTAPVWLQAESKVWVVARGPLTVVMVAEVWVQLGPKSWTVVRLPET
jgi:hypothetical protein